MSSCPCRATFINSIFDSYEKESSSVVASKSAIPTVPTVNTAPAPTQRPPTPVFAKSCERGSGCTDAGTEKESHSNFGKMAFYQAIPSSSISSGNNNHVVEQRAQSAKRKPVEIKPEAKTPWYKRVLDRDSVAPAAVAVPVSFMNGIPNMEL